MYFETGQGSEFTYGKHNGIDMTTTEALCYGLARRYDPFMVNNVTGFIGPETHLDNFEMILANLQDHFMGKLLGLPMGMAPCYTLAFAESRWKASRWPRNCSRPRAPITTWTWRSIPTACWPISTPARTTTRRCARFTGGRPRRNSWPGPSGAASLRSTAKGVLARGPIGAIRASSASRTRNCDRSNKPRPRRTVSTPPGRGRPTKSRDGSS